MDKGKKPIEEKEDPKSYSRGSGQLEQVVSSDETESSDGELDLNFMTVKVGYSNLKKSTEGETSNVAIEAGNGKISEEPPPEGVVVPQDHVALPAPAKRNPPCKALSAEELARLAREDPKCAKRILTNRMSAMRSKERKRLHISVLEQKQGVLRSQSSLLSAKSYLLQAETRALRAENAKLKERMNTILPLLQLQEALNEQMRSEIHYWKTMKAISVQNEETLFNVRAFSADNVRAGAVSDARPPFPLLPSQIPNLQEQFWQYPPQVHNQMGQHTQPRLLQQLFPQQPPFQQPNELADPTVVDHPPNSKDDGRTASVSSESKG